MFIQDIPCIRTKKVAKVLASKGIQTDLLYLSAHPSQLYRDYDIPYKNIYRIGDLHKTVEFINKSDYDVLYSSNEPDYLTVLFLSTNKPVVHDTHDMMSLRGKLSNEQIVLEYIANTMASGNIYTHELVRDIALNRFPIEGKPILVIENYVEKSMIPQQRKQKLSVNDGEIHCVYEGGLASVPGHHRFLEEYFLKIARERVHIHIYGNVDQNYIRSLIKKSEYIHYEGTLAPNDLLSELTKYDIGLAIFNVNDTNRAFLDSASPNKVFDYLAAGLPIGFSNLTSFKLFNDRYKVGKILDFKKPLLPQLRKILEIKIPEDFLVKNKLTFNDQACKILNFLKDVKHKYKSSTTR